MIIAGNFKTNHTRATTKEYIENLNRFLETEKIEDEVAIFPQLTALDRFDGKTLVGAQNAYPTTSGSFTGEAGVEQLSEFGVKTILLGHSERRHILKESNELIVDKFNFFKENGFRIYYCIGEPLEVREKGLDATLQYMEEQLKGIDLSYENVVVAYEPVWAIGTGVSATIEDIKSTCKALQDRCKKPILYGGSVKASNVKEIFELSEVDGVLIGTASWKLEDFKKILTIAKNI